VNANVAVSTAGTVEVRLDRCLLALEDVLHQCEAVMAGFPGLAERLIARRTFKSHDIAVRGLARPELPHDCVELEDGTEIRLLSTTDGDITDADGEIDLQGLADDAAIKEALARALQSDAFRTRHHARSLTIARDVATALRLHLGLLKAAGVIRREALTRSLSGIGAAAPDRRWGDSLRARVSDGLNALSKDVSDLLKRTFGPDGRFQHTLGPALERLGVEDLARDNSGRKTVRLTVKEEFRVDLLRQLHDLTATEIARAIEIIHTTLDPLDRHVSDALPYGARHKSGIAGGPLPEATLLERLEDYLQLTVRYRGVLPQRGFFHRLAEGRRSIFTVLMFFSLFGSFLGFNWRTVPLLGWLFLGGFVFAVVHTYRSWVEEDQERIDEELEKARDQFRTELRRIFSELARESQAALLETIEQRRRALLSWIDDGIREATAQAQKETQTAREAAQLVVKQLDLRDRQYADLLTAVTKIANELGPLCPKAAA
jgi:hypothetical protein